MGLCSLRTPFSTDQLSHGDLEPPRSMLTFESRLIPMMMTVDEAWALNVPKHAVPSGFLVSKGGLARPRAASRRLSPSQSAHLAGTAEIYCLHTHRNGYASVPAYLGREGTGYSSATWTDGAGPPQLSSASSLTSPAQSSFRLHAAATSSIVL